MSKVGCPACTGQVSIPEELGVGQKFDCPKCDSQLFIESLDPIILVELADDRLDSARGDLRADHGGTYTLQELIADIIDNSIDATAIGGTCNVVVDFGQCEYSEEKKEWEGLQGRNRPYVIIEDDAKGMDEETLARAMGKGNTRDYPPWELGHYGVGLKKSSLSSAYEITVFSKVKGGEILCSRYSSCYIERFDHNGIMDEESISRLFPWMIEADSWSDARERLEDKDSGTVVLLEGLPNLIDTTKGYEEDDEAALNKHIDETSAYLSLVFGKYLEEGGAILKCWDDEHEKEFEINKKLNIEVDVKELTPLDPFFKDFIDKDDNFGTLYQEHVIKTEIRDKKWDMGVNIFIIPNNKHPKFKKEAKKRLDMLMLARKSADPVSLQGCYIYRNKRLVDFGQDYRWKGAYTNNSDPKRTLYRWEVILPVHSYMGDKENSEWEIDTSKSVATPTPRMRSELQKIAEKRSVGRWHDKDPKYEMNAGARAKLRREKTGNGTVAEDWERWPHCTICKKIPGYDKTVAWDHKAPDHKCSFCGKKGHEGPWKEDGTGNKKCGAYVARPIVNTPSPKGGEDGGKNGEDGSKNGGDGDSKDIGGEAKDKTDSTTIIVTEDSAKEVPISVEMLEGTLRVDLNPEHAQFPELMSGFNPLVEKWKKTQSFEEE